MTDFTTGFVVDGTPDEVFAAINDVRSWWTGDVLGGTDQVGEEFTYRYEEVHRSTQRVTELVPGRRVAWQVLDAHLAFAQDPTEWNGTRIVFEIAPKGAQTELRFTHEGLVPDVECFDSCSNAWGYYVNTSLRARIAGSDRR